MGPTQMWRFITPWPESTNDIARRHLADVERRLKNKSSILSTTQLLEYTAFNEKKRNLTRAAVDYYNVVLLADEIDASLVAMAMTIPGLDLTHVLYMSAKTTHTGRRPPVEPQPPEVLHYLHEHFYGSASIIKPFPLVYSKHLNDAHNFSGNHLAPDTELYFRARARLRATINSIGKHRFQVELHRFRRMQSHMLTACSPTRRKKNEADRSLTNYPFEKDQNQLPQESHFPTGISPRALKDCLYGDQGCGYRCIDAWVADRQRRLARFGRQDVEPSPADETTDSSVERRLPFASLQQHRRPSFSYSGRNKKGGEKYASSSSSLRRSSSSSHKSPDERLSWEPYRPDPQMLNNMEV
uniref:Uncharacterized protein n=1 Tax=Aureoumbra lagunensis TaxID=44058 RepID=A0A7S3NIW9_9STRA|mmetsp:Transcript_923/g.1284  ORF Transcript_923/g.1284 Transcript_923/m.1284 type:complete len:355 (-) Transcript_923:22-1086(-)